MSKSLHAFRATMGAAALVLTGACSYSADVTETPVTNTRAAAVRDGDGRH
jgi:hypothetical protein